MLKKAAIDAVSWAMFHARRVAGERFLDSRRDSIIIPSATYSPWLLDGEFMSAYRSLHPYTKLDIYRLWSLWSLVRQTAGVPGCIVEVGCWRGGSGAMMAKAANGTNVWLYDTFDGCLRGGRHDNLYAGGEHADASPIDVASARLEAGWPNMTTVGGVFPESSIHPQPVRLAHIDVDTHDSAANAFFRLSAQISTGGIVVFDDYGFSQTRGVTVAVDRIMGKAGWAVIHNLNGQAIAIKTAGGADG